MGYTPTLIIRKRDLDQNYGTLEQKSFSLDYEESRAALFLMDVRKYKPIVFDGLELVIAFCDTTSFNRNVRELMEELKIDFREDD